MTPPDEIERDAEACADVISVGGQFASAAKLGYYRGIYAAAYEQRGNWWNDPWELLDFADWYANREGICRDDTITWMREMMTDPWAWNPEYAEFCASREEVPA